MTSCEQRGRSTDGVLTDLYRLPGISRLYIPPEQSAIEGASRAHRRFSRRESGARGVPPDTGAKGVAAAEG